MQDRTRSVKERGTTAKGRKKCSSQIAARPSGKDHNAGAQHNLQAAAEIESLKEVNSSFSLVFECGADTF